MVVRIFSFTNESEFFKDSMNIRYKVFVDELHNNKHNELTKEDIESVHFLLTVNDKPAATARITELDKTIEIHKLSVIKELRHRGLGMLLLRYIINDVKGSKKLILAYSYHNKINLFVSAGFIPEEKDNQGINIKKLIYRGER